MSFHLILLRDKQQPHVAGTIIMAYFTFRQTEDQEGYITYEVKREQL